MKIGIICPSDIAMRRFLPALSEFDDIEFCGVGINSVEERYGMSVPSVDEIESMLRLERNRGEAIVEEYGGKLFDSYTNIVHTSDIDVLYIPLPPALHYKWALQALQSGKHVLVEKPATTSINTTRSLIKEASERRLALHENYMFVYHDQIKKISQIIDSGELGDIRLYRISFGFPLRAANDFRYDRRLGGGALLDAGGYTIKYASLLLGDTAKVICANMNSFGAYEVDMYGSGTLINDQGKTVQISFGMDNEYKCELEVWGSKAVLVTGRVLTAPTGFVPTARIIKNGKEEIVKLPADNAFKKSIERFKNCTVNAAVREENYLVIERQARLVQDFMDLASDGRENGTVLR